MRVFAVICASLALADPSGAAPREVPPAVLGVPSNPPGADPTIRWQIDSLYGLAGFDRELNMLTRRLSAGELQPVLQALTTGSPPVRISASVILTSVVKQDAVRGQEALASIQSAISRMDLARLNSPILTENVDGLNWHLRVRGIDDPLARAAYLAPSLRATGSTSVYYTRAAIDYLAECGEAGDSTLAEFLKESTGRSIDPDFVKRATLARQKVQLMRDLREQEQPRTKIARLLLAIAQADASLPGQEFAQWAFGELVAFRPEADADLQLWRDDAGGRARVSAAARFALGDVDPLLRWRW